MPIVTPSDRVPSGTPGFDELVEGGFVKGSTYLVAGQAGTGKSIFTMQFLLEGLKRGETCVYLSLEQRVDEVLQDMDKFEWGGIVRKCFQSGQLIIVSSEPTSMKDLQDTSLAYIAKVRAGRFVLDSLTVAALGWKTSSMDEGKIRSEIFSYMRALESTGVTALLISEIPEGDIKRVSMFGFEEFLVDGVVVLHYLDYAAGGTPRSLMIRKMRRTNHGTDIYPFEISKKGVAVKNN